MGFAPLGHMVRPISNVLFGRIIGFQLWVEFALSDLGRWIFAGLTAKQPNFGKKAFSGDLDNGNQNWKASPKSVWLQLPDFHI